MEIYVATEKIFYTKGRIRGRRISPLAEIPLKKILIGWDDWIKKRVNNLSCIDEKGGLMDICVLHKMPHYILLYYKIYFGHRQKR